jgi:hypothetical protein
MIPQSGTANPVKIPAGKGWLSWECERKPVKGSSLNAVRTHKDRKMGDSFNLLDEALSS